jgi:hypothetical protein
MKYSYSSSTSHPPSFIRLGDAHDDPANNELSAHGQEKTCFRGTRGAGSSAGGLETP